MWWRYYLIRSQDCSKKKFEKYESTVRKRAGGDECHLGGEELLCGRRTATPA